MHPMASGALISPILFAITLPLPHLLHRSRLVRLLSAADRFETWQHGARSFLARWVTIGTNGGGERSLILPVSSCGTNVQARADT
jgi:hypothetical protein